MKLHQADFYRHSPCCAVTPITVFQICMCMQLHLHKIALTPGFASRLDLRWDENRVLCFLFLPLKDSKQSPGVTHFFNLFKCFSLYLWWHGTSFSVPAGLSRKQLQLTLLPSTYSRIFKALFLWFLIAHFMIIISFLVTFTDWSFPIFLPANFPTGDDSVGEMRNLFKCHIPNRHPAFVRSKSLLQPSL